MSESVYDWLQEWYVSQCDGDWEHEFGVRINTLDNPGWAVEIDLSETTLANKKFVRIMEERGPDDWIHCRVEKERFEAFGGPQNLGELLAHFRSWVESTVIL